MKIDFHVHTDRSPDGIHNVRTTVKHAKKTGLDAIAITDHQRHFSCREARALSRELDFLVIPGIEGGNIAFGSHWIGLGIDEIPQPDGIDAILTRITAEGGVSIAPHPHSLTGFTNYAELAFDAVETLNATDRLSNLRVRNRRKLPEVAGSDAHAAYMIGYAWTELPPCDSVEEVLDAVRKGDCAPAGDLIPAHQKVRYWGEVVGRNIICNPSVFVANLQHSFGIGRRVVETDDPR
jgi:predicted metal-dependent phosphoesterase TrpH